MNAPSPKADALRAMREAKFARIEAGRADTKALRDRVAAVPAKKPRKAKAKKVRRGKA